MNFTNSWNFEVFSKPFPGKDHDAFELSPHAVSVADGATPLEDDWPQDIKEFSKAACLEVNTQLLTHNARHSFKEAILQIRKIFKPAGFKRSAGLAVAYQDSQYTYFATLGDVGVYVRTISGLTRIRDNRLVQLDENVSDTSELGNFIENRKLMNTEKGYPVFADNVSAANGIILEAFKTDEIEMFVISTDGGWRIFDSCQEVFFDYLREFDLQQSINKVKIFKNTEFEDDVTILVGKKS